MCCVSMAMPWETDREDCKPNRTCSVNINVFREGLYGSGSITESEPTKPEIHIKTTKDVMGIFLPMETSVLTAC